MDMARVSLGDYKPCRIEALRHLRAATGCGLKEAMWLIAESFGFKDRHGDDYSINTYGATHDLGNWKEFMDWQDQHKISLEPVQGRYALTILKAIAAKYASVQ
jgi:hypothetical protein